MKTSTTLKTTVATSIQTHSLQRYLFKHILEEVRELKKLRNLFFIGTGTKLKMCESRGRGPKGQTVKSGSLKDSPHSLTHTNTHVSNV